MLTELGVLYTEKTIQTELFTALVNQCALCTLRASCSADGLLDD